VNVEKAVNIVNVVNVVKQEDVNSEETPWFYGLRRSPYSRHWFGPNRKSNQYGNSESAF
jgi:hypothetical protein